MYFFGKNFRTTREICNRAKEVEGVSRKKTEEENERWHRCLQHV